jgi:hypothetical protein
MPLTRASLTGGLLAAALAGGVCTTSAAAQATDTTAASAASAAPRPVRKNPDRIAAEEIAARPTARDAWELIRTLRPAWLHSHEERQVVTDDNPLENRNYRTVVLRDGQRLGWIEELRTIQISAIGEIRHYAAREAVERWGLAYGGGAILILSPGVSPP